MNAPTSASHWSRAVSVLELVCQPTKPLGAVALLLLAPLAVIALAQMFVDVMGR